jgi:VCBS repeat-containing protein
VLGLVVAGAVSSPGALFAVQHEVSILLDLDDNPTTGCTVPTVDGPFDGVEQVLITTVETSSPPPAGMVTDVAIADCVTPATDTFGPPASFDGGWPIGIDNGEGGLDVVETYFPLLSAVFGNSELIRLAVVVTDELGGEQALLTVDDTPGGAPILLELNALLEIPTLGEWGLILLALLLAAASLALLGRRGTAALGLVLVVLAAGAAWAAGTLDGLTDDWSAGDQLASDGIVLFGKKVDDTLCFRVDVELLFNNPPQAMADTFTGIAEDSSANPLDVLANDTDPNPGDTFTITSVGPTSDGGTVAIVGGGTSLEYTPAPNFFGTETFTYTITDSSSATGTANVSVTVDGVNDAPTADDDAYGVDEGGTLNQGDAGGVLAGDTDPENDPLTAVLVSGPSNASSFTLNADGSFDYTHDGSETTSDSFTYRANDGALDSNVATVTIAVNPVNDAPVADDDAYGVDEGGTLNQGAAGGVLDGDTDPEGDPLTAVLVSGPANASAFTLNPDGSFDYTHDGSETTSDSFTYKANDGALDSNTATVTITINPVNDPPVADDDAYAVDEGGTLNQGALGGVLDGDTDAESDPLTAILVSGPSNASSFTLNPNGSFDYTHNGSETTSDSFTYKANDGALDSNTATVTITINPVNDAPVADDDAYGVNEGGTVSDVAPGVLAGDTDAEGNPLQALLVTGPSHASSFTLNTDGSFSYTHDGTETPLVDSFTYRANDGLLDSNVATVTITITPVNDPPVLDLDADNSGLTPGADYAITFNDGDPAAFLEDTADATITDADNANLTSLTVTLTNLIDPGFEVLDVDLTGADPAFSKTYDTTTDPSQGVLTITAAPARPIAEWVTLLRKVTYFNGDDDPDTTDRIVTFVADDGTSDSNTATSTVTVVAVNDAPTADDDAYGVNEGETLNVAAPGVLDGDTDPEGDTLDAILVAGPANASSFTLNADGSFDYTHDGGETTSDSFTYKANDGALDSNTATVTITITAVNDAPVAVADSATVDEGGTVTVLDSAATSVLANDTDAESDPLTAVLVSGPTNESAFTLNNDGTFSYTHDGSETTSDAFTYKANDGSLDSNTVTVSITVNAVNDAPVAVADAATVDEGGTVTVLDSAATSVLANDTDGENDPLTAVLVSGPANESSFTLNSDGTFSYTHDGSETTSDSFTYKANDGSLDSNTVTVSITVNPVNDAPVAVADSATVDEGGTVTVLDSAATSVLANDTDAESDPLTAVLVSGPANESSFTLNNDGTFSYTHNGGETTSDSFTYKANDGSLDSNTVTVTITINPVNDPPVANPDTADITEEAPNVAALNQVAGNVLTNDTDPDSVLSVSAVEGVGGNVGVPVAGDYGSVTINADGSYTYSLDDTNPTVNGLNIGDSLTDDFGYTASDGSLSDSSTLTVTIHGDDDPATPDDDAFDFIGNTLLEVDCVGGDCPEDTVPKIVTATPVSPAAFGVLDGDVDPDGGPPITISGIQTCADVTAPFDCVLAGQGTVSLEADGSFTFVPEAGDADPTATFQYKLTGNTVNVGTVTLTRFERVWYMDNSAPAGGNGTSATPFNAIDCTATNINDGNNHASCTVDADLDDDADQPGDYIFIHYGLGTTTGLDRGFRLEDGQHLIGEFAGLTVSLPGPGTFNGTPLPANVTLLAQPGPTDCGGGPCRPMLDDTIVGGPECVSAIDVVPIEIVGLNLAGSSGNAIDWTTGGAFAATGALTIADIVVRSSVGEGVDVNLAGTGAFNVSLAFHDNTITAGTTGADIQETGTGSLTITAFDDNIVSGDSGASGLVVNNALFDAAVTAGVQPVSGGTTVIGQSGNGVTGSGLSLSGVTGDLTFTDLDIFSGGTALGATGGGGFDLDVTSGAGQFVSTGGPAVSLSTADLDIQNALVTSTTTTGGVSLTSVSGTFSASSGSSISKSSGATPAFSVASSSATVNYAGTINVTGGAGVDLDTNTGAVNFTGQLTLNTGTSPAFEATGANGTVTATHASNSLTTTTATALNVNGPDIGAGGLVFQSISANGAAKGIVLNSTGTAGGNGGLSVTGTGTTDGSGGTIQNNSTRGGEFITTKALSLKNMNFTNANTSDGGTCTDLSTAACNAAIYLSGVTTVSLDNINITGTTAQQAINGINVSNFTLNNSTLANCGTSGTIEESCIKMRGLTGTSSITNSDLSFPGADVVEIVNSAGPTLTLNVDNSTFRDSQSSSAGNTGIQARSEGTASIVLNVTNSSFLRIRTVGLHATAINSASNDVDVTNSTFDAGTGTMIGLDLDADNSGILVFNVQNNPLIYARNGPAVNVFGDTNATINGRINNNPDVQVKTNVGSNVGSGIRVNINKDATARIEVEDNVVNVGSDDAGIDLSAIGKTTANPGGGTNTLDATVTGNNVTIGATSTYGVIILSATNAGDTNALCANVGSNAITRNPLSITSFRARVPSANGFFRMQGFVTDAEATWNANSNTPISAGGSEVSFGGSGTFAACTAALPTNPGPN